MLHVLLTCDRCHQKISGVVEPGIATSGFYNVSLEDYQPYARAGEVIVCDKCMSIDLKWQSRHKPVNIVSAIPDLGLAPS